MNELSWDDKLRIHTVGRDASHSDPYHHPYEPTPYCVLQRLAESGWITPDDHLLDYGCGKGRVPFFLHHTLGCRATGIEYDETIHKQAVENATAYGGTVDICFLCQPAEQYSLEKETCLYFFNPFSAEILRSVLHKVVDSFYRSPRRIRLFFYYPDDEYLRLLLTGDSTGLTDEIYFLDEIDCSDLFDTDDPRERVMIFELI